MEEGSIGHAVVGGTHEIAYVDLPPICVEPKDKLRVWPQCSNDHKLPLGAHLQKSLQLSSKSTNKLSVNY
jgi:hypothetical protein